MIILDTHIWLSYLFGDPKIKSSGMLKLIDENIKNNQTIISTITLWETAMLATKGRIQLSENTKDWLLRATATSQVRIQEISIEIAADSCNLPGNFHGDPADRLIVATARALKAKLLTLDKQIIKYAKKGYIKV